MMLITPLHLVGAFVLSYNSAASVMPPTDDPLPTEYGHFHPRSLPKTSAPDARRCMIISITTNKIPRLT